MNKKNKAYILQASLFIITVITTTLSGAELMYAGSFVFGENRLGFDDFLHGFYYTIPFLGFLTVHEFGHYITARIYRIKVTLPYYIPFWFGFLGMPSFGSMGALIRITGLIRSRKEFFDIGIAGPLAGFVIAIGALYYGFTHLPPAEHIFLIHPEYQTYGLNYAAHVYNDTIGGFAIGKSLIFIFFERFVASDPALVPNVHEVIHYPWIFAGYLALLFTSLNLLPIGQLDGGHILYGLVGARKHRIISASLFVTFIFYAGTGLVTPNDPIDDLLIYLPLYALYLYYAFYSITNDKKNRLLLAVSVLAAQFVLAFLFPTLEGYPGWLFFAFIVGRALGVYHPPAIHDQPLDLKRKILGWLTLIIFIICFSPQPFITE